LSGEVYAYAGSKTGNEDEEDYEEDDYVSFHLEGVSREREAGQVFGCC
jgi:hypothetical protein